MLISNQGTNIGSLKPAIAVFAAHTLGQQLNSPPPFQIGQPFPLPGIVITAITPGKMQHLKRSRFKEFFKLVKTSHNVKHNVVLMRGTKTDIKINTINIITQIIKYPGNFTIFPAVGMILQTDVIVLEQQAVFHIRNQNISLGPRMQCRSCFSAQFVHQQIFQPFPVFFDRNQKAQQLYPKFFHFNLKFSRQATL